MGMPYLSLDDQGRILGDNVTWMSPFPTVNGRYGFSEPARGMVFHTEVGWEHSVDIEFEDPNSQASAFCAVAFGGHINQFGPIGKGWLAWTQAAGNPFWRGVEHEDGGDPTKLLDEGQLQSTAQLLELFSWVDGFPIQITDDPNNGYGLITHQDGGADWGGHECPGPARAAQRADIVNRAHQIRSVRLYFISLANKPKVTPMFSPALALQPIAAAAQVPGGGVVLAAIDGSVYAFGSANFWGGANGHAYWGGRQVATIKVAPFPQHPYTIQATDGAFYDFGYQSGQAPLRW